MWRRGFFTVNWIKGSCEHSGTTICLTPVITFVYKKCVFLPRRTNRVILYESPRNVTFLSRFSSSYITSKVIPLVRPKQSGGSKVACIRSSERFGWPSLTSLHPRRICRPTRSSFPSCGSHPIQSNSPLFGSTSAMHVPLRANLTQPKLWLHDRSRTNKSV